MLALVGCTGPNPRSDGAAVEPPVALSYPYPVEEGARFPDYRTVAEGAAGIYVRVRILSDESAGGPERAAAVVNSLSYASGIIVDPRGYVVTAAHIALSEKFRAEVTTLDGRRFQGRVVAVERGHELGLIKINPFSGMAVARFADSGALAVGMAALAIGTPRHLGGVVSVGRVLEPRHRMRIAYADFGYDNAIVLAMEVEPGHSGGPVLDREGRVIGMIASFVLGEVGSKAQGAPHLALAVPSNDITDFLAAQVGH